MTEAQLFTVLATLQGVEKINAVRAQDRIKHFNVFFGFESVQNQRDMEKLLALWAFSSTSVEQQATKIEFMVRPEEVEEFARRIRASQLPQAKLPVSNIILEFDRLPSRQVREAIQAALRPNDNIFWRGMQADVVLVNCKDVQKVRERLQQIALEAGMKQLDLAVSR